jgi:hypothetical protein
MVIFLSIFRLFKHTTKKKRQVRGLYTTKNTRIQIMHVSRKYCV